MKLLGWLHREFRQNNSESIPKDFSNGKPPSNSKSQRENCFRNSFASLEAARVEVEELEEESSAALTELFHGFLAIGTLGTEPITTDLSTPTFSVSVDNIAEKETQVTETELKLINEELEKVLQGSHSRNESYNFSSGRNSHVSAGRSSHVSTITLGGKQIESAETNGNEGIVCPLQNYLFGSAIGLPETVPQPAKKEHRTSLGELFQKTKFVEENYGAKSEKGEKKTEKETAKSAIHLMKKMLKKKLLHASSKNTSAASGEAIESASADHKKLHKILQMFHRKVHPETSSTVAQKSHKATKNEMMKSNITNVGASDNGGVLSTAEYITIYPQPSISKESQSYPSDQFMISDDDSGNGEHWVKTDADYLVLEL
ncbi:Hypothetical predicted protein [Olea europaea subsp. europaea]|uniref:LAZY1 n=1 Tax=Olea europaea subsp. europaea TaxID=158383 RepID=A0A8S0RY94_OLEEU|nr:Hypothetical predicted protein [Olea europaea subsp. europaea]